VEIYATTTAFIDDDFCPLFVTEFFFSVFLGTSPEGYGCEVYIESFGQFQEGMAFFS
jgi:hypothetical protein